jgi:hypothetical protein
MVDPAISKHNVIQSSLSEFGISPAESDYGCVRIAPPDDFVGVKLGVFSLPFGELKIQCRKDDQEFIMEVDVPIGTHVQVRLPAKFEDLLYIDGEPIPADTQTKRSNNFVELAVLPGSKYLFNVVST